MGAICSKRKLNEDLPASRRPPPGKKLARRSLQPGRRHLGGDPGSLLRAALDAAAASFASLPPHALRALPPDLAQLLLDALLARGALDDAAVLSLRGVCIYSLRLGPCGGGEVPDFWLPALATAALEALDLSHSAVGDGALAGLPPAPRLHDLRLDHCAALTDGGLRVLERLPALRSLSLAGCEALGPPTVALAARACPALRSLNLDQCRGVSALAPLAALTSLTCLDLGWCGAVGDADALAALPALAPSLRDLRLSHTRVTDAALPALRPLTRLTALALGGLPLTDAAAAAALERLPLLRALHLERCPGVGDAALGALARACPALEELELAYSGARDAGVAQLGALRRLRRLGLDACAVGDRGLEALSTLLALEELDLSDTPATDASMPLVGRLPRLRRLNLSFTAVGDAGLRHVAAARALTALNLDSRLFTDAGMEHVALLPALQVLDLFGAAVTDAGCAALGRCRALRRLELCSGVVTDAGVATLCSSPALAALRHLSLAQNHRVGNAAIPALMRLGQLTSLNLSQSRVTGGAAVTLGCLPALRVLSLAGTRVRAEAVDKLQALNGELEVLGVRRPG